MPKSERALISRRADDDVRDDEVIVPPEITGRFEVTLNEDVGCLDAPIEEDEDLAAAAPAAVLDARLFAKV